MVQAFVLFLQRLLGFQERGSIEDKSRRLNGIYRSLDKETAFFRTSTGLYCPDGCGHCCATAGVETTTLEMLPMALALERRGESETWYRKAETRDFAGQCIFYTPTDGIGSGCCAVYPHRPLICRLFGFSGNRDKYGKLRLVGCSVFKKTQPDEAEAAYEGVLNGTCRVPGMSEAVMQASCVDPGLSREHLPINTAFKRAVEIVWLNSKYRTG